MLGWRDRLSRWKPSFAPCRAVPCHHHRGGRWCRRAQPRDPDDLRPAPSYGVALLGRAWSDRRATLERLELQGPRWQTPPTFEDGGVLHGATREQGLDIVSKRVGSIYRPGVRSPDWLKSPHRGSTSVVIGGWRPESTERCRTVSAQYSSVCRARGPSLPGPSRGRPRGPCG